MGRVAPALLLFLSIVAACGSDAPTAREWEAESWRPLVEVVPSLDDMGAEVCEEALSILRESGSGVRPAPNSQLADAAEAWVRRAETVMFECSARNAEFDYVAAFADLDRLEMEVEALLAGDP